MIKAVTIKNFSNSAGDLVLTLTDPELSQGFAIVDMDGLGPVNATVNSSDWATIDGSKLNSIRLPKREINMELRFIPTNNAESIADIRQKSYLYFPIKNKIGLIFTCEDYSGKRTGYYIEGYVTKNEQSMWSSECGCEISIFCPDPYFSDVEYTEESFSQSEPKMLFPFATDAMELTEDEPYSFPVSEKLQYVKKEIINKATIDIGAQFILKAHGTVKNPTIYNETTYEQFGLNYTMKSGEIIVIDTRKGHKSVILKEGLGKNYLGKMALNSDWISLVPGINVMGLRCDSGFENIEMSYKTTPLYIGI